MVKTNNRGRNAPCYIEVIKMPGTNTYPSWVDPLNTNMVTINGVSVIDPSGWSWGLQDVSASDAGRDESATMHKMTLAQKLTYQLEWKMIDPYNAKIILQAVNQSENFNCVLWNPLNEQYETHTYYSGDRNAQMQQWHNGVDGKLYTKIALNLIEV